MALASTMVLAACNGGSSNETGGNGDVELTFWLFGTTKYEELAEVIWKKIQV
ncbi:hypothetical protein JCM19046_1500 [Bacillus sp. JCM 19046]|nr:hypothetical protein JCM19045_2527 [Bacillus sp. JCM 19045]GAF17027.1 hypothetical protein JCM19046_1500 [Bacillus sp. JCM 19046]